MRRKTLLEKLEDKFLVGDGCWEWTASKTGRASCQYGHVVHEGRHLYAHRALYELLVGPVPDGYELDHLCRNTGCVRPAYMEPVTHAENMRRSPLMGSHNRTKTHCPQGHPYDERNTYRRSGGQRVCLACARERERAKRARRRLEAVA